MDDTNIRGQPSWPSPQGRKAPRKLEGNQTSQKKPTRAKPKKCAHIFPIIGHTRLDAPISPHPTSPWESGRHRQSVVKQSEHPNKLRAANCLLSPRERAVKEEKGYQKLSGSYPIGEANFRLPPLLFADRPGTEAVQPPSSPHLRKRGYCGGTGRRSILTERPFPVAVLLRRVDERVRQPYLFRECRILIYKTCQPPPEGFTSMYAFGA